MTMDAADVAAEAATTRYAGRLQSASGLPGISLQVGVGRNRVDVSAGAPCSLAQLRARRSDFSRFIKKVAALGNNR
jgi:hypothetical protein